jgi:hypothetical protein
MVDLPDQYRCSGSLFLVLAGFDQRPFELLGVTHMRRPSAILTTYRANVPMERDPVWEAFAYRLQHTYTPE